MSSRISPTTAPKMTRMTGIWTRGPRFPSHWKKLLNETPIVVGRASSTAGRVIRKRMRATMTTAPMRATTPVVRVESWRFFCFADGSATAFGGVAVFVSDIGTPCTSADAGRSWYRDGGTPGVPASHRLVVRD
jgi:hypothetical protein